MRDSPHVRLVLESRRRFSFGSGSCADDVTGFSLLISKVSELLCLGL